MSYGFYFSNSSFNSLKNYIFIHDREIDSHQKRLENIINIDVRKKLKQKKEPPLKQVHERKARQNNFEKQGLI